MEGTNVVRYGTNNTYEGSLTYPEDGWHSPQTVKVRPSALEYTASKQVFVRDIL